MDGQGCHHLLPPTSTNHGIEPHSAILTNPYTTSTLKNDTLVVGVLPPRPQRDTPEMVSFYVGCHRDQEHEGARNTKFRQVRAAESVILYVLCGLYCLRW
jgi:hypothetical protein